MDCNQLCFRGIEWVTNQFLSHWKVSDRSEDQQVNDVEELLTKKAIIICTIFLSCIEIYKNNMKIINTIFMYVYFLLFTDSSNPGVYLVARRGKS